jgi:hypothetical protein
MKPGGSRRKGHDFERWVVRKFKPIFGEKNVRRGQQSHGAFEPDVVVLGTQLWHECQHSKRATPLKKLEQAERDKPPHMVAVAITKENYQTPKVTLRLKDWYVLSSGVLGMSLGEAFGDDEIAEMTDEDTITLSFEEYVEFLNIWKEVLA